LQHINHSLERVGAFARIDGRHAIGRHDHPVPAEVRVLGGEQDAAVRQEAGQDESPRAEMLQQ
jgi:hypothetical protein